MMKTTTTLATALMMLATAGSTFAEDTDGFETALNAGLTLTDGNSDTMQANAGITTKKMADDREYTAGATYNNGESDNQTTTDNASANAKVKQSLRERLYGYMAADYLYDDIAAVDYRVTVGPGLGLNLIKRETTALDVDLGVVWVNEDVAQISDDYIALRVGETFEHQLSETAKIWQSVVYTPELNDFDNYTLTGEVGAESAMTETVALRVVVQDRFDNTPGLVGGVPLKDNDISVIAGVSVKL